MKQMSFFGLELLGLLLAVPLVCFASSRTRSAPYLESEFSIETPRRDSPTTFESSPQKLEGALGNFKAELTLSKYILAQATFKQVGKLIMSIQCSLALVENGCEVEEELPSDKKIEGGSGCYEKDFADGCMGSHEEMKMQMDVLEELVEANANYSKRTEAVARSLDENLQELVSQRSEILKTTSSGEHSQGTLERVKSAAIGTEHPTSRHLKLKHGGLEYHVARFEVGVLKSKQEAVLEKGTPDFKATITEQTSPEGGPPTIPTSTAQTPPKGGPPAATTTTKANLPEETVSKESLPEEESQSAKKLPEESGPEDLTATEVEPPSAETSPKKSVPEDVSAEVTAPAVVAPSPFLAPTEPSANTRAESDLDIPAPTIIKWNADLYFTDDTSDHDDKLQLEDRVEEIEKLHEYQQKDRFTQLIEGVPKDESSLIFTLAYLIKNTKQHQHLNTYLQPLFPLPVQNVVWEPQVELAAHNRTRKCYKFGAKSSGRLESVEITPKNNGSHPFSQMWMFIPANGGDSFILQNIQTKSILKAEQKGFDPTSDTLNVKPSLSATRGQDFSSYAGKPEYLWRLTLTCPRTDQAYDDCYVVIQSRRYMDLTLGVNSEAKPELRTTLDPGLCVVSKLQ